ncbi:SRPBCC family protein [Mucilaginibacter sp. NFX135]|uniref:SRPBCC family protein n=1 Tax=Mucilaginibacter sp. NFX135 TaxID=3402687 RepID=UPI003AFB5D2E
MWKRTYSTVTTEVTKEQLWKLFADVNNWHNWDTNIEFAKIDGQFEAGNSFILRPKGGPNVKIQLLETIKDNKYIDVTNFPLAKMYDEHLFEDTPEGVKITNTIWVTGLLSFVWVKLVAQKIVDDTPADMQKQIAAAKNL